MLPIWQPDKDCFGKEEVDRERGAAAFNRLDKRVLVARILRMQREANAIEETRRAVLLTESREGGWSLSEILPNWENEAA